MSTNINISVGDNKLLDQARLQQNAGRQAQLEKEANQRLAREAEINRVNALAAKGLDANGNPVTGAPSTALQIDRRPAANRFGANEMLFYFRSAPTVDANGFGTGPAIIKKRQSAYKFNTSITPNYPANPGDQWVFSATGGPYSQSYISEPSGPQIGLSQRYIIPPPSTVPSEYFVPSAQFKQTDNNCTYELDFKVDTQAFGRIDIRVDRYYSVTTDPTDYANWPYQKCTFSISNGSPGASAFSLSVFTDRTGGGAPSGNTTLNSFPVITDQWNRLALTASNGNLLSVYLNGTLSGTFQLPFSLWSVPVADIDYVSFSFDVNTFNASQLSVSAAKITPKILYTQNYTPSKLT